MAWAPRAFFTAFQQAKEKLLWHWEDPNWSVLAWGRHYLEELFSMQTLREGISARAAANAWAIVRNFWRYLSGAKRAGRSPVELAGGNLRDILWLQVLNLLTRGAWSQA